MLHSGTAARVATKHKTVVTHRPLAGPGPHAHAPRGRDAAAWPWPPVATPARHIGTRPCYVTIQGPLAFEPLFRTSGLVSVATAAQAMLARVLMHELTGSRVRVNQLVIYATLGWGDDDQSRVSGADIGRYVTYLLSDAGASAHGQTIHLMSPAQVP